MMRILRGYNNLLHAYPLVTQCTTTGFLLGCGDVIAQTVVEKPDKVNWERTAKFAAFGLLFVGPVLKNWFVMLEKMYGATGKFTPIKKVLTDQLAFAPILQLTAIPVLGLMNNHSTEKIKNTIRNDYKDIMIGQWTLWPPVQLINFYYVPLNYRLPVVALVSLVWNVFYTWKLGDKSPVAEKTETLVDEKVD